MVGSILAQKKSFAAFATNNSLEQLKKQQQNLHLQKPEFYVKELVHELVADYGFECCEPEGISHRENICVWLNNNIPDPKKQVELLKQFAEWRSKQNNLSRKNLFPNLQYQLQSVQVSTRSQQSSKNRPISTNQGKSSGGTRAAPNVPAPTDPGEQTIDVSHTVILQNQTTEQKSRNLQKQVPSNPNPEVPTSLQKKPVSSSSQTSSTKQTEKPVNPQEKSTQTHTSSNSIQVPAEQQAKQINQTTKPQYSRTENTNRPKNETPETYTKTLCGCGDLSCPIDYPKKKKTESKHSSNKSPNTTKPPINEGGKEFAHNVGVGVGEFAGAAGVLSLIAGIGYFAVNKRPLVVQNNFNRIANSTLNAQPANQTPNSLVTDDNLTLAGAASS